MTKHTKKQKNNNFLSLITTYGEANKLKIGFAVLLSVMATISSLLFTYSIRELLDGIPSGNGEGATYIKILIFITLDMVGSVSSFYILGKIGNTVVKNIRNKLWKTSVYLPSKYFQTNKTGELTSRIVNDTSILYEVIASTIPNFVSGLVSIVGSLAALFLINVKLSLMLLCILPIMILVMKPMGNVLSRISATMQTLTAELNQATSESLRSHTLIKSLHAEDRSIKDIDEKNDSIYKTNIKQLKIMSVLNPLMNVIILFSIFLIIIVGGLYVQKGILTMGTFIAFIIYTIQLISPATNMATLYISIRKSIGATDRILVILNTETERKGGDLILDNFEDLQIIDGTFRYNENYYISNVNMSIQHGEIVGIIGESGSGKSTLLKILTGIYPLDSGQVLYNNVDINQYNLFKLREKIGYVDQENSLVGKTIRDNLLYGIEDVYVTDNQIWDILEKVGLYDFVKKQPAELESYIGELGNQLSGGQKQRMAIARALIRENDILVFDEITSSLDKENKKLINDLIYDLSQENNKTIIYVTHEEISGTFFDKIYQVEDGTVF